MKFNVIGTGSTGNCYLLQSDTEILIIEAGVKYKKVKQAIDFQVSKIVGLLVSHSHADHAGYVKEYTREGIKVYTTPETIHQTLNPSFGVVCDYVALPFGVVCDYIASPLTSGTAFHLGNFHILPFDLAHDVPCLGFLINHPDCGNTLFITDTHYSPYTFNNLTNIIIEANYSDEIINENLATGKINATYYERVLRSHLSFENMQTFLHANDLTKVKNIILIHLSDANSDSHHYQTTLQAHLGIPTHIAQPGLTINFFQK
jgi:phosphoribosyl 1,2-cyclic phosphodiesterase